MFPIQMPGQRDKLVAALGAAVSSVDEIDNVMSLLEQLGRDHRRFSVVTEHCYTAVGASLLATLKKFLGHFVDPGSGRYLGPGVRLVVKVMVAAAEQHEDIAPACWEADVVSVERRSVEVAVIEVAPRQEVPLSGWPVGRRGDSATPSAVALLQSGQRSPALGACAVPHPAHRWRTRLDSGGSAAEPGRHGQAGWPQFGEQLTLPKNGRVPDLLMIAGGTGLATLRAVLRPQLGGHRLRASGAAVPRLTNGLEPLRRSLPHPAGQQARGLPTRRWSRRIPPTLAPGGLSVPWLPTPATGLTGRPWSAARREWSGTRCRSSGLPAFLPPRSAASSSTFFKAPS